jgi:multidrug transporter EmrE-like cation transporter
MKGPWMSIGFALILAILLTISHSLLRAAAAYTPFETPWILKVGFALFLYGLVFFAYTFLLRYFNLSTLYPVYTALSIAGVCLAGIGLYGESFTVLKGIGLVLLVIGVAFISW